jgi:hypothetical protein
MMRNGVVTVDSVKFAVSSAVDELRPALEEAGVQMSSDPEFYDVHYVEK